MSRHFKKHSHLLISFFILLSVIISGALFAGSLTPPTPSPAPTMYTLDDIYNLIHNKATSTHSLSTSTSPAKSMHSVSDIYVDLANLIDANNVASGTTYLGVTGGGITPAPLSSISVPFEPVTVAPTSTGYTLDDVYNLVTSNTRITSPNYSYDPSTTPTASMHDLNTIYSGLANLIDETKVATGTTYLGKMGTFVLDITPPTVISFTIPAIATSTTISITTFTATDNILVTGYELNESASPPLPGDSGWTGTIPTTYTFSSEGLHTLYAWAKDAAGNVSASRSGDIIISISLPDRLIVVRNDASVNVAGTYYLTKILNDANFYTRDSGTWYVCKHTNGVWYIIDTPGCSGSISSQCWFNFGSPIGTYSRGCDASGSPTASAPLP